MINKATILGRLGRDPETRHGNGGDAVTRFSLATTNKWKSGNELKEHTEWHRVVCFGRTAEIAGEYLRKGRLAHVEGELRTNKWTDKDGTERYTTEIICQRLTLIPDGSSQPQQRSGPAPAANPDNPDFTDDIPF